MLKIMGKKIFTILCCFIFIKTFGLSGIWFYPIMSHVYQGSHRLEEYLNIQDCLEKSLKIKSAFKSTGKSLKSLEKSLNSILFCRTYHI